MTNITLRPLLAGALLLATPSSYGVGYRLPNQDPEAIARGNAFAATADNPSAIYYNPAGITQLEGQHFQFGLYSIIVNSTYRSPSGRRSETEFEIQSAPQLYYTFSPTNKPYSLGFGVFSPYGLGVEWPDDTGFRTLSREAWLAYASVSPVLAWEVNPRLSLAVGPTINIAQVKFRQGILAARDKFSFRGNGLGLGFSAGLLWKISDQWSFGLNYRGPTDLDFEGRSKARPYARSESTSAGLEFPQYVVAGISYRPSSAWNFEVNIDWADWDTVNQATFKKASGNAPFPLNFRSSLMYEAGVTRYFENRYFMAAGYFFSENSVPDRNFNPAVPDTDQHSFSVGVGRKGERWNWALTYQLLTGPWRKVENSRSTSLVGESADGRYRFLNNAVNVSVTRRF